MGAASMGKWLRWARVAILPPGARERGWYSHQENRDFRPTDGQLRATALHLRLRARRLKRFQRVLDDLRAGRLPADQVDFTRPRHAARALVAHA